MGYLVALEGGGTRSQAVLMDSQGQAIQSKSSAPVNTNFVTREQATQAVVTAVHGVLESSRIHGSQVDYFISSIVGPAFGEETFGELCPHAVFRSYGEMRVVFARAGIYRPHGVSVVAATGATTWSIRSDDHREVYLGGWGSLLGDEGSAYALGLFGLRAAVRAFEERAAAPTSLLEAVCQYFGVNRDHFRKELCELAYQKPLNRTEIAGFAAIVSQLAGRGDPLAAQLTRKVAIDLTSLALTASKRLFSPTETFHVVIAGGLTHAGELIMSPFQEGFQKEFPNAVIKIGRDEPAVALGRLALYDIKEEMC